MKVQKQNMNVTTSYLILARHVKQQNDLNILSLAIAIYIYTKMFHLRMALNGPNFN